MSFDRVVRECVNLQDLKTSLDKRPGGEALLTAICGVLRGDFLWSSGSWLFICPTSNTEKKNYVIRTMSCLI
jgi:hypothetical protein